MMALRMTDRDRTPADRRNVGRPPHGHDPRTRFTAPAEVPPSLRQEAELVQAIRSREILTCCIGQRLSHIAAIRFRDPVAAALPNDDDQSAPPRSPGRSAEMTPGEPGWLELAFEGCRALVIIETPSGDALEFEWGRFDQSAAGQALADTPGGCHFHRHVLASVAPAEPMDPAGPADHAATDADGAASAWHSLLGRRLVELRWFHVPGFSPQAAVELDFGRHRVSAWVGLDCTFALDLDAFHLHRLGYHECTEAALPLRATGG